MKIAVVGTGYVGLVTGTCFAETGNTVTCIDIDHNKVNKLKNGTITIYEPGLEQLFERNIKQERLFFTTNLAEGIKEAKVIFLALPTPFCGAERMRLSRVDFPGWKIQDRGTGMFPRPEPVRKRSSEG